MPPSLPAWVIGVLTLSGLSFANYLSAQHYKLAWLPGAVISIGLLVAGIARVGEVNQQNDPKHFSQQAGQADAVLLKVRKPPKPADQTLKIQGRTLMVWRDSTPHPATGRLLTYVPKDSLAGTIQYGDVIACQNSFTPLPPPANPEQFDRKAFLANKQIYHQGFLDSGEWHFTGSNIGNPFFKQVYDIRNQFLSWLSAAITDEDAFAVAAALLAGYKAEIDPDLRASYASTGAMHVLAVSGLHVGIIYLMLSYALSFLNPLPYGPYLKLLLIVGLLWVYACITGLPSSVIRACTMFSFVAIGTNLQRNSNIYNSIVASLFLLLLVNPYLITQVGFQLSYAAVIGIVFLQPRVYHWFPQSRYWLLDKIWAITAVSIAAQLSTFPLTLFYFNQFPTYFMISNLVVIPAAMLIVPTGFAFFALKAIGMASIGDLTGTALDGLLQTLNYLIGQVEALPYALIDQLYIDTLSFYLIYGVIIGLSTGMAFRKKTLLFAGLMTGAGVLGIFNLRAWQQQNLSKLAYLKVDNRTVVTGLGSDKALMKGPQVTLSQQSQVKFFTYRFLWSNGLDTGSLYKKPISPESADKTYDTLGQQHTMQLANKEILIACEPLYWPDTASCQLEVDHLLITHEQALEPRHLAQYLKTDLVILGYELPPWTIQEWQYHCRQADYRCYNLQQKGALVKNL